MPGNRFELDQQLTDKFFIALDALLAVVQLVGRVSTEPPRMKGRNHESYPESYPFGAPHEAPMPGTVFCVEWRCCQGKLVRGCGLPLRDHGVATGLHAGTTAAGLKPSLGLLPGVRCQ